MLCYFPGGENHRFGREVWGEISEDVRGNTQGVIKGILTPSEGHLFELNKLDRERAAALHLLAWKFVFSKIAELET